MKSLLELIKSLYGSKAISSTIGTRTNVVRLPSGKLQRYLSTDLNMDAASDAAIKNAYEEIKQLIPEVPKMNDAEKLIFEGNLRRLSNRLEGSGLLKEENVSSGVASLQSKVEQLKQKGKELEKVTGEKATLTDVLNDMASSQQSMSRMYDEGLVRATARQILINDIKAGKIKNITISEAINMKEPLDPFRQMYGEGALEQLDSLIPQFRNLKTEIDAEKLARSKFKFEPDEARPKESYTKEEMDIILKEGESKGLDYLMGVTPKKKTEIIDIKKAADKRKSIDELIDEYNANQDRLLLTDEEGGTLITYPEFNKLKNRNDEIAKALEEKGIKSTPEVETKPEGEVIPFRKKPTEPEGKANGGRIGFQKGTIPKILEFLIEKISSEKGFDKSLLQRAKPKAIQDLYIEKFGALPSSEEIAGLVNKQLKQRTLGGLPIEDKAADISDKIDELAKSEINTFEKKKQYLDLRSQFIDSLDPRRQNKNLDFQRRSIDTEQRLILKAEEKGLDFDTFEELRKGLYDARKQKTLNFMKTGKVDLEPVKRATTFEEVQDRYRAAAKAADEIFPNYDTPKTAAQELAEVMAEQKYNRTFDKLSGDKQHDLYSEAYNYITSVNRLPKMSPANVPVQVLENKMNEVLNQYDKSMFIKNEQGMVDVNHPQNVAKMEELLRKDHPELYDQLKKLGTDLDQKEQLLDFDVTGRKPNASGGLNYLMGL